MFLKLEATEALQQIRRVELLPDFDVTPYAGLDDRFYAIYEEFDFREEFLFIHSVVLDDYGYALEPDSKLYEQ